jgi:hypothetical protein
MLFRSDFCSEILSFEEKEGRRQQEITGGTGKERTIL